ncbi:TVP38/TMEM64 family protein [Microcoleus sp. FACHB-1515]|uniref:TVP38/TMEM64 family protein n=1 Tax=Cyanophyceae TaxID=3028117 RepID=UPI00168379DB|nr:TVP38/TMEM64 family protein [Microcoleus sp. FACHB-1515]MBD2088817.1 TVP38/TMEM64 family protein [Microcoleus sp. FACHB-1515]
MTAPADLIESALVWVDGLGTAGAIAFVGLYIAATIVCFPSFFLTLGAGAVYGWLVGSVVVFIGATLGSIAAFLIGRYLARGWVADRIARNSTFQAIDRAVGAEGLKIVLLTRLSPVFPFVLQNYAYGITQVSLRDYVLGAIGMIPGTLMYVYIGALFGNLAALFSGAATRSKTPIESALYGLGLIATIAASLYIAAIARNALRKVVE